MVNTFTSSHIIFMLLCFVREIYFYCYFEEKETAAQRDQMIAHLLHWQYHSDAF